MTAGGGATVPMGAPGETVVSDRRPASQTATWNPLEAIPVALIFITLSAPVQIFLQGKTAMLFAGLISELCIAAAVVFWTTVVRRGALQVIGIRFDRKDIVYGVICGMGIWVGGLLIIEPIVQNVLQQTGGGPVRSPQQLPAALSFWQLVIAGLFVVAAGIGEELFFRGFVFKGCRRYFNFWVSGLIASVLFGLAHYQGQPGGGAGSWLLVIVMFFVGFALAAVYERRRNVVANICSHATFNLISIILIGASLAR